MFKVAALYKFTRIRNPAGLRNQVTAWASSHRILGTLLIAPEGVNGTLAGDPADIDALLDYLSGLSEPGELTPKYSYCERMPFHRLKIRLKREIVTLGRSVDPMEQVGKYVPPEDWNALISDPEVTVVDTRNDYEIKAGTFRGAVDPGTRSFTDFPQFVDTGLAQSKGGKVAMFCTGGIRCEKATAFLLEQGFNEVYHLEGGILNYLEKVPEEHSLWEGECFVFDERVTVNHQLKPGQYTLCGVCRRPLSPRDREHPDYERGVSCAACVHETPAAKKAGARERQRQLDRAHARGNVYFGNPEDTSKFAPGEFYETAQGDGD